MDQCLETLLRIARACSKSFLGRMHDSSSSSIAQIGLHFCHAGLSDAADGGGSRGGRLPTARKKRANNGGHFVLEACVSQKEDHWKEVGHVSAIQRSVYANAREQGRFFLGLSGFFVGKVMSTHW